ncbi:hypothetical protein [Dyella silvatica]|uniref:hypothetical protein n=1 Tax=Dyella silvatica TaxID=2992128 RepID=UPI002258CA03|nr:hypothetical protein [Dyella silvatica]
MLASPAIAAEDPPLGETPAGTETAQMKWQASAIDQLAAMPDADALLTAAALAATTPSQASRAMTLLDRASAMAPQAADIGLLGIQLCSMQADCAALPRETRLRQLDPHNGIAWMTALHDASGRADAARIDDMLNHMTHATRFDIYFVALTRRFNTALDRVPRSPDEASADDHRADETGHYAQAMNMAMSLVMPAFQDLVRACKPGSPAANARRETCRQIVPSLEQGDSLIANLIGLRIHEWTASDANDLATEEAQYRRLSWQMKQQLDIATSPAISPAKRMAIVLAYEREMDRMAALLTAAGKPLDPPAHWQPQQRLPAPPLAPASP